MPPTLDGRAKSIIDQAIDLDAHDRTAFLNRACAGDLELARRVESLLAAMEKDDAFLHQPTLNLMSVSHQAVALERPGDHIGPYTLVELIGEGGFGSVYLAEQSSPVRRQVALKIIKLGMDTRQVIARFEAERQALAMMEHPNIARVLDAGATDTGRPYFVMELVRGEHVTDYCDRQQLSIPERLALFCSVCGAVQHAHQKGIIHRDLKPSNVLVTTVDGRSIPKVIDFGIAKATTGRLSDVTLNTEIHQLMGTPDYMSPEQAESSGADIDTRSDIYSMGVLLFELLTGHAPFDRQRLRSAPYAELQRILREEEPPCPSVRLATPASSGQFRFTTPAGAAGESQGSSVIKVAQRRRTEPIPLTRAIRGDLDWIVLKCLEKDRSRRYETASALAEDIWRHLNNQPVLATPPSALYRLRKFVRRNRGLVMAGGIATAALFVSAGVSFSYGLSEAQQRMVAERARRRAEKAEGQATERANELEQVARFQQEQLSGMDAMSMGMGLRADLLETVRTTAVHSKLSPEQVEARVHELEKLVAGSDFTGMALEALERNFFVPALDAIDKQFADQPLVRARLLQTLASTLYQVGLLAPAIQPQKDALEIRRRLLGDDHVDTLISINHMGTLLRDQGKLSEAEAYYREALEKCRSVLGDEHEETIASISNMGNLLMQQDKLAEAEPLLRDALEKHRRVLGDEHPHTLITISSLGGLLRAQGRLSEAEPYYHEALEKRRRVLGEEHLDTIKSINNMGFFFGVQGKLAEAEPFHREALEKCQRTLGDEHPETLNALNNMGAVLKRQGKLSESEPYFRKSLEIRRRMLSEEHPATLTSMNNLAMLLVAQGKPGEAEPLCRESLEGHRKILGNEHARTIDAINNMGVVLRAQGKLSEAEPYCYEGLEMSRRMLGDEHADTLLTIVNLGGLLLAQGKDAETVALLYPAEAAARRAFTGGNALHLARLLIALGRGRTATGEFDAAQSNLTEAYEIVREARGATSPDRRAALTGLVELFASRHAAEPDKGYGQRANEWRSKFQEWKASTQPTSP